MALRVWLPLNGDLENKGISDITFTSQSTSGFSDNGKIGKCLNTLNSYYYFTIPQLVNATTFSCCFWYKQNGSSSLTTNWRRILDFTTQRNDESNGLLRFESSYNITGYAISVHSNGNYQVCPSNVGNRALAQLPDTWYHIAMTLDGSIITFYVNGEIVNSGAQTTGSLTGAISICETNNQADGWLNDLRIYDHCLSAKEVKEISQGLVLHYKLDSPYIENSQNLCTSVRPGTAANVTWGGHVAQWTLYDSANDPLPFTEAIKGEIDYGSNGATGGGASRSIATVAASPSTTYTYSCYIKPSDDFAYTHANFIYRYEYTAVSGGTKVTEAGVFNKTRTEYVGNGWYRAWGTFTTQSTTNAINISFFTYPNKTMTYWLGGWQIEQKDHVTPFMAPGELRNAYVVDSSGYENNAIQNNIVIDSDSSRYLLSAKFNGTDSYIKTSENNWMPQGAEALTVNLWAKATTWPTNGGRLVSCTESGGFNLEAGNSGYWRFPIYVYTNAEKTSRAYKYDSNEIQISALTPNDWNMITLVYDTTGTKTYINGELHHTYTNTSYGISFNTNARLFLGCEAATANPSSPYFNGNISDFRIYATAFSAEDIADLYHTPANIDNLGNIHGFEFEEKQGNMLAVSPLAGSLTWDSENNYYIITSQPSTSTWGIGPSVGITPKKIIPWGYSYRLSYEVYSPVAATWNIDYNNNTVDATLSGNDNDTGRIVTQVAVPANQWTLITLGCSNTNSTKNPDHLPLYDYSTGLGPIMNNQSESITWYMRNPQWYLVDTDESTNFQIYENGIFKTNFLKEDNLNDFASFKNNEKATWGVNLIEK